MSTLPVDTTAAAAPALTEAAFVDACSEQTIHALLVHTLRGMYAGTIGAVHESVRPELDHRPGNTETLAAFFFRILPSHASQWLVSDEWKAFLQEHWPGNLRSLCDAASPVYDAVERQLREKLELSSRVRRYLPYVFLVEATAFEGNTTYGERAFVQLLISALHNSNRVSCDFDPCLHYLEVAARVLTEPQLRQALDTLLFFQTALALLHRHMLITWHTGHTSDGKTMAQLDNHYRSTMDYNYPSQELTVLCHAPLHAARLDILVAHIVAISAMTRHRDRLRHVLDELPVFAERVDLSLKFVQQLVLNDKLREHAARLTVTSAFKAEVADALATEYKTQLDSAERSRKRRERDEQAEGEKARTERASKKARKE